MMALPINLQLKDMNIIRNANGYRTVQYVIIIEYFPLIKFFSVNVFELICEYLLFILFVICLYH